jgi:YidC/Oxa1 family membrane protein insertase
LFYWHDWLPEFISGPTGWLGPYFNLLPILSMILFLVQQKLFTPPPTDEQQEIQQKVMKFMTLFMGVLFFKVPAGLCIYFIASGLWSIGERKLLPKSTVQPGTAGGPAAQPALAAPAAARPARPARQTAEGMQPRLDALRKLMGIGPAQEAPPESLAQMQRRRRNRKK